VDSNTISLFNTVSKVDMINFEIINQLNITGMPTSLELGTKVYVIKKVIRIGILVYIEMRT
jgi:hypothetical protein